MNRKLLLYVENIPPSSSEEQLIEFLGKWAPVQQVHFLREKQCTKRSVAAFVRVANESHLDLLMSLNQQKYRDKRLFMLRCEQTAFFQADHTVIVRNITTNISEENLYDHFEACGKIEFLQIRTDDFAYISFENKASVKNAMNKNNMPLKGFNLKTQLLTRNIEMMVVNLDTLPAKMPDLYRKLIVPVEQRQAAAGTQQQQGLQQQQPQQPSQQQQQFRNQQQQQTRNQQQLNQRQQQQQQRQPQQQPQPQHHQEPQKPSQPQWQQHKPQQQQISSIQLLKAKAQAMQQQQQQQQKPLQQEASDDDDIIEIIDIAKPEPEPIVLEDLSEDDETSAVVPPPPPAFTVLEELSEDEIGEPVGVTKSNGGGPPPPASMALDELSEDEATAKPMNATKSGAVAPPPPASMVLDELSEDEIGQSAGATKSGAIAPSASGVLEELTDDEQNVEPNVDAAFDDLSEGTDDEATDDPTDATNVFEESDLDEMPVLVRKTTAGVPPIPSRYRPKPNDVMRPIKASEISMQVHEVKNEKDARSVWINHIPSETLLLDLVLYLEQFGDVEACQYGFSSSCYLTRWAKVCFVKMEGAKRATEYFLHPFEGHYLFVMACSNSVREVSGKVFLLDYLSKFLIYEDVAKAFKHVGEVFYLVRPLYNSFKKVRIFFLKPVNVEAVLAVKSIGGKPIKVEQYHEGMPINLTDDVTKLRKEREVMDLGQEGRMTQLLAIFREERLSSYDPVVNPRDKTEGIAAIITNVPSMTTQQQIMNFLQPAGTPTFIRRERDHNNWTCQRLIVGFRTLSMVLKAAELSTDKHTLNGHRPFIFPAWVKPHVSGHNTLHFIFDTKDITVQSVYNAMSVFGAIRFVEKPTATSALVCFDNHEDGMSSCHFPSGALVGGAKVIHRYPYKGTLEYYKTLKEKLNKEGPKPGFFTQQEIDAAIKLLGKHTAKANEEEGIRLKMLNLVNDNRRSRGESRVGQNMGQRLKPKKLTQSKRKSKFGKIWEKAAQKGAMFWQQGMQN